jgi:Ca-activated chloride channel homolog
VRLLVGLVTAAALAPFAAIVAQEPAPAVFKSGVERVAVAAIVRDTRGKLVSNLQARDFELLDSGRARPLIGAWSEPSPASVAILMDASGSMATKMDQARETAHLLVSGLKPGVDEVAFYSFDTELRELKPFTKSFETSMGAWTSTRAYGATSLWDAVASTAQRIADRQQRRALIVITDGVDSASKLKPAAVSGIASALDVPVYMLVISFALEGEPADSAAVRGPLADLATWTGGDSQVVRDTPTAVLATQKIVTELQHQYVVAFEPGTSKGWHPLVLRTRNPGFFVRARSGYMVK